jgi:3-hydroxy-9,10-secoandrosta-1,3,5(10)-triene-9,17-dione monooxygenase
LREHAARSEADRRATDEVIAALTEAGLYRMMVPTKFCGYEADMRTVLEVIETLSEADGSIGWLIATGTAGAWIAGRASERLQREIFGQDSDARVSGSGMALRAQRVDGGIG